jgi:hypothetical protein
MANRFPPGWDEERVQKVLARYETQTDDEAVAEDEVAGFEGSLTRLDNRMIQWGARSGARR